MCKKRSQKIIEKLDPSLHFEKILKEIAYTEFPWDFYKANEFALFRTFAVPSIAKLLLATKQFTEMTQKRYDDTVLILAEIFENTLETDRGRFSLKRLNEIHGGFKISNQDFLYVLAGFAIIPNRWINQNGHRQLTEKERKALYLAIKNLGENMNIQNIPESFEAMEKFHDLFEEKNFAFSDAGKKVADKMVDFLIKMYLPEFFVKFARPFVYAFMDEKLCSTLKFPKPNLLVRAIVKTAITTKWVIQKLLPSRTKPRLLTTLKHKSYPHGYQIESLGYSSKKQD